MDSYNCHIGVVAALQCLGKLPMMFTCLANVFITAKRVVAMKKTDIVDLSWDDFDEMR